MTRKLFTLALAAAAALLLAPAANAGLLVSSATDCADQSLDQTFLRWADVASYTLHPGGSFDSGPDWSLDGGAAVVKGNEAFYVTGEKNDTRSLYLPADASATSGSICVGIEHPDVRFLARASNPFATLSVQVLFEDATGELRSAPIGAISAGSSWAPTVPLPIAVNLLPLLPGERTAVAFKFTAQGGSFQVDDVYVDPYRSA
jgi:hypothetical protein